MEPTITVEMGGLLTRLANIGRAVRDLRPVFAGPINKSVDTIFRRQFDSEGAWGGQKWRPLAPVTLKLRARRGHGRGGVGRDTNRMWASFTKLGIGPDAVKVVTPTSLLRGTSLPYARWFHQGWNSKTFVVVGKDGQPVPLFRKRPKRIAARPVVPTETPREITAVWERVVVNYIMRAA